MGFLFGLGKLFLGGREVGTVESVKVVRDSAGGESLEGFSVQGSGSVTIPVKVLEADIQAIRAIFTRPAWAEIIQLYIWRTRKHRRRPKRFQAHWPGCRAFVR